MSWQRHRNWKRGDMLSLIGSMFRTPESQADPYSWSAAFGGHAWVALGPWGLVAIAFDMWTAAWVVPLAYLVLWEGLQWIMAPRRTPALAWDCILDTCAVAFGCLAAALLGNGYQIEAIACWGASVGVMATGWRVRS